MTAAFTRYTNAIRGNRHLRKLGLPFTAVAGAAPTDARSQAAQLREFEGRLVSIDREAKRFRLRDAERGTVRIRVTRNSSASRPRRGLPSAMAGT